MQNPLFKERRIEVLDAAIVKLMRRRQLVAHIDTIRRTRRLKVGGRYFLSVCGRIDGCWIRVQRKSLKTNIAGYPSSVEVEVTEPIGSCVNDYLYAMGSVFSVNACNLYQDRSEVYSG